MEVVGVLIKVVLKVVISGLVLNQCWAGVKGSSQNALP